ncbi:hypothetical protein K488DRAFT_88217 [Vararia minispora EC-137]|uniref:Uncharacterized protein n=1 Tax=Vararia minispora EC-137 TaxID=1314806 RepID=A0ACB8QE50_9AGAM|nr:hypothetical protein K488DRAFT_88217 [Vararia minispora EC-137]
MQRFLVALFAAVALLAVSFPIVEARSSSLRRETNADRLRRGLPIMAPANFHRRHTPTTGASAPGPSAGASIPPSTGLLQCRGNNGTALGYVGSNYTLVPSSSDGYKCSFGSGILSVVDDIVDEASSIIGAVVGALTSVGSTAVTDILGTSQQNNALTWALNSTTGCLTPSYTAVDGQSTPCGVLYNATSNKLQISASADVTVDGLVSVSLYLVA